MISAPTPGFGELITVLRPGTPVRDVYGNDVHGPDEERPMPGCSIVPRSGSESVGGQDTVVEYLVIFAPPAADVRPTDRLRIRGLTYTVHGPVEVYRSPLTGTTAGVQITGRRITG